MVEKNYNWLNTYHLPTTKKQVFLQLAEQGLGPFNAGQNAKSLGIKKSYYSQILGDLIRLDLIRKAHHGKKGSSLTWIAESKEDIANCPPVASLVQTRAEQFREARSKQRCH